MKPSKRTGYRWIVLTMIFLTYMIAGADRANIGVVIPTLKQEFHLTNADVGAMASLFYITYAAIQIPAGYFIGKFGIRQILVGSMVLTSISTMFLGLASNVLQLKLARSLLGLAEGPINIAIVSTINRWFPAREKGLATGVFMAAIKFSPAFVPPLCAYLIIQFGWREVFYFFAAPGFIVAGLWYWLVKDNPHEATRCSESEVRYIQDQAPVSNVPLAVPTDFKYNRLDKFIRTRNITLLNDNRAVLSSWSVWGCALGYFFLVGITYAIMTWVPTYLVTVKKFTIMKMGVVAAAPWVGAIVGNLLGGYLSDRVFDKRRKPMMLLTSAATVGMMYALIYAPNDPLMLAALLFSAGVMLNLGYSTFLVYPMAIATKDKVPFAASIVNTCGSLGGAFAPFIVGLILDSGSWDGVFLFLAACSFITFLLVLSIIEPRGVERKAANQTFEPQVATRV